jgi:hypothetical protein
MIVGLSIATKDGWERTGSAVVIHADCLPEILATLEGANRDLCTTAGCHSIPRKNYDHCVSCIESYIAACQSNTAKPIPAMLTRKED